MASIDFDATDFLKKADEVVNLGQNRVRNGLKMVAEEILRLSQFEVPHDVGTLQNTGHVDASNEDDVIVGYNTVYAARLHEHPEYHFQKGRKGKYLEDPIKNNLSIFAKFIGDALDFEK